jgi:hypothetical protein
MLVADFLKLELAPAQMDDKLRFRTLIAANLLRIAHRELDDYGDLRLDDQGYVVPAELLAEARSLQSFADDLEARRRSLVDPETFALAVQLIDSKLRIAAPEVVAQRAAVD